MKHVSITIAAIWAFAAPAFAQNSLGTVSLTEVARHAQANGYKTTTSNGAVKFTYRLKTKRDSYTVPAWIALSGSRKFVYVRFNLRSMGPNPNPQRMKQLLAASHGWPFHFSIAGTKNLITLTRNIDARLFNSSELARQLKFADSMLRRYETLWSGSSSPATTTHLGTWQGVSETSVITLKLQAGGKISMTIANNGTTFTSKGSYTISGGRLEITSDGTAVGGPIRFSGSDSFVWKQDGAGLVTFKRQ